MTPKEKANQHLKKAKVNKNYLMTKLSTWQRILLLLLIAFAGCQDNSEEYIRISRSTFVAIYENGFHCGRLVGTKESLQAVRHPLEPYDWKKDWTIDSLFIITKVFNSAY